MTQPHANAPVLFHQTELHARSQSYCDRWHSATFLYRYFGEKRDLLYIGITNDFLLRDEAHVKSSPWRVDAFHASIEIFPTRRMAEAAEAIAIEEERPPCNAKWPISVPPEEIPIFAWYLKENGGKLIGQCRTWFDVYWSYPYLCPEVGDESAVHQPQTHPPQETTP